MRITTPEPLVPSFLSEELRAAVASPDRLNEQVSTRARSSASALAALIVVLGVFGTQSLPEARAVVSSMPMFIFAGQSNMAGFRARQSEALAIDPTIGTANVWSSSSGGFGPEQSAASILSRQGQIAVVKLAVSGSDLHRMWSSRQRGGLYDQLINHVRSAISALSGQGIAVAIKAIFWMQGESDSYSPSDAGSYAANLDTFVESLRKDLGGTQAPFYEAGIAHAGRYTDVVRAQQKIAARRIRGLTFIPTDDLERRSDDPLHLDTKGTIELGKRLANTYLSSAQTH